MPDLELIRDAIDDLERMLYSLSQDGKNLASGISMVEPHTDIAIIRTQNIKTKLARAMRLAVTLEVLLKK